MYMQKCKPTQNYMYLHVHVTPISSLDYYIHININQYYFEFAENIFQQTQGTAMEAAFSPTIANIFMSIFFRNFHTT